MAALPAFLHQRLERNPDLGPRIVSGAVIALIAAIPIILGGPLIALLAALAGGAMAWEFRQIHTQKADGPSLQNVLYAATPVLAVALLIVAPLWVAVLLVVMAAPLHGLVDHLQGRSWHWSVPGLLVIGLACVAFPALRAMEPFGLITVLWIIMVVVSTDIGAYAFGRALGGPKLWPRVSPKKTWAGLLGGMLCAVLAGAVFAAATTDTNLALVCMVSAVAALVAQGGDLCESAVKRRFGVKDASALIPGHGGALDRLDGFVAATLAVAVSTYIHGRPVFLS
jgi:phosphatidate cytidylyltransferase